METTDWTSLTPYFLAIASNLCFGTASVKFSEYSVRFGASWLNQLKVTVALIGFLFGFLLFEDGLHLNLRSSSFFFASGILGLFLGDWFLFRGFANLGATRTLVLYSFQPFLLGIYGFIFLGQSLGIMRIIAIACMIACVFTFVLERNRTLGKWDMKNFGLAFVGIGFDALGIVFSRQAYESSPDTGSFEANATRALGAVIAFNLLKPSSTNMIYGDLTRLKKNDRIQLIGACLLGTFVALTLFLKALKTAHIASLTAISITGPIWVSIIEHVRERRLPNRYLVIAFSFFLVGFFFMSRAIIH
jgi:drug/metabolite transporter (DMT)-like permease